MMLCESETVALYRSVLVGTCVPWKTASTTTAADDNTAIIAARRCGMTCGGWCGASCGRRVAILLIFNCSFHELRRVRRKIWRDLAYHLSERKRENIYNKDASWLVDGFLHSCTLACTRMYVLSRCRSGMECVLGGIARHLCSAPSQHALARLGRHGTPDNHAALAHPRGARARVHTGLVARRARATGVGGRSWPIAR